MQIITQGTTLTTTGIPVCYEGKKNTSNCGKSRHLKYMNRNEA